MPLSTPALALMPPVVLSVAGAYGVGRRAQGVSATFTSNAWGGANRAQYSPIYIERPGIVTKFWVMNGATANANIDIGLYRDNYTLIVAKGSTAQSGTNVIQEFDVTDFAIAPGVYFLGLVLSATTGTVFRQSVTSARVNTLGITQEALGSTALPSTATPATNATSSIFTYGLAFRTLIA